jgi:Flp pilus assembly protein TadD
VRILHVILALICCWPASAQVLTQGLEGNNYATEVEVLQDGTNVGFALVRSRSTIPNGSIEEAGFSRSKGVTRVLYDQKGGSFFGYRLEVETIRKRQYRFEFKSLPPDIESELIRYTKCPQCPRPALLAGAVPRFPGPLTLSEGDICTIDLLINPQTGEKIVDVIMVSSKSISKQIMQTAAGKTREAMALLERGDSMVARGNSLGAINEYKKALAINPNDAVARNRLGISYQRVDKIGLAQEQFEHAVKLNEKYAEAWNNLASCYHKKGRYKQAIQYYAKAIEAKPTFATAYKHIGTAYIAQKRFEDGYRAFQAAFRLDPTILEASTSPSVQVTDANAGELYFYYAKLSAANKQNDAAMDFLMKSVAKGFRDCFRIAKDTDLRTLLGLQTADANASELNYYFARLSAANKLNDAALDFLAKAVEVGFKDCSRITQDTYLRVLAPLPRFKQILQSVCPQQ